MTTFPSEVEALAAIYVELKRIADALEKKTATTGVVHLLRYGFSLCDGRGKHPSDWPPGNHWTHMASEVTCEACLSVMRTGAG